MIHIERQTKNYIIKYIYIASNEMKFAFGINILMINNTNIYTAGMAFYTFGINVFIPAKKHNNI